jgi:hypothetical protein
MAFTQSLDFRPSSRLSIDHKPSSYLFDESLELSEDHQESTMISPTNTDDRRDSFGNNTAPVFSPTSTVWGEDFSATTMPERQFNVSTNPFQEQSNNPFM